MSKPSIQWQAMNWHERSVVFAALGFGSGLTPKAPGTAGSAAVLLLVPLWLALGFGASLIVIALMSLVGIYICDAAAKLMQVHDDGRIVWDEFAGQSMTLLPLLYWGNVNAWSVLLAFALFRLFDVWKPWPVGWADAKVGGGLGIMLDDLIAGVWAAAVLLVVLVLMGRFN